MPCSAATVIGIVCDADVALAPLACSWSRYSCANEPGPKPCSGRSANSRTPPLTSFVRPLVALLAQPAAPCRFQPQVQAGGRTRRHDQRDRHQRARRRRSCRARPSASAASTARPSSSAAMLDCEKLVTRPASSHSSTAAAEQHLAAAHAPQHHRRHRDHHQRQEAPVDVRVEEQRVHPEVVAVLVRPPPPSGSGTVACGSTPRSRSPANSDRQRHRRSPGTPAAARASSAPRAAARTAARTARRRRPCSPAPSRSPPSSWPAARTARPTAISSHSRPRGADRPRPPAARAPAGRHPRAGCPRTVAAVRRAGAARRYASAPAPTTRYSGISRFEVLPPVEIGRRNGSADDRQQRERPRIACDTSSASAATTARPSTTAPAASAGWSRRCVNCEVCQMSIDQQHRRQHQRQHARAPRSARAAARCRSRGGPPEHDHRRHSSATAITPSFSAASPKPCTVRQGHGHGIGHSGRRPCQSRATVTQRERRSG